MRLNIRGPLSIWGDLSKMGRFAQIRVLWPTKTSTTSTDWTQRSMLWLKSGRCCKNQTTSGKAWKNPKPPEHVAQREVICIGAPLMEFLIKVALCSGILISRSITVSSSMLLTASTSVESQKSCCTKRPQVVQTNGWNEALVGRAEITALEMLFLNKVAISLKIRC